MITKVKATDTSKIHDTFEKFMKNPNNTLNCNFCSCVVFCNELLLKVIEISQIPNAFGCRSKLLLPRTLQTFLRSSNTDFMKKITKVFLSANILMCKLNNKHTTSLLHDIVYSLPSETTCKKYYGNQAQMRYSR